MFKNKLFDIHLDKYDNDNKFIKKRRYEDDFEMHEYASYRLKHNAAGANLFARD